MNDHMFCRWERVIENYHTGESITSAAIYAGPKDTLDLFIIDMTIAGYHPTNARLITREEADSFNIYGQLPANCEHYRKDWKKSSR